MTSTPSSNEDMEVTTEHKVSCNGGSGALGHPRVYLEMGADGEVTCGYCDKHYVLKGSKADPARG